MGFYIGPWVRDGYGSAKSRPTASLTSIRSFFSCFSDVIKKVRVYQTCRVVLCKQHNTTQQLCCVVWEISTQRSHNSCVVLCCSRFSNNKKSNSCVVHTTSTATVLSIYLKFQKNSVFSRQSASKKISADYSPNELANFSNGLGAKRRTLLVSPLLPKSGKFVCFVSPVSPFCLRAGSAHQDACPACISTIIIMIE